MDENWELQQQELVMSRRRRRKCDCKQHYECYSKHCAKNFQVLIVQRGEKRVTAIISNNS